MKGACDCRSIVDLLQHIYVVRILHVKGARDCRSVVGLLRDFSVVNFNILID